MYFQAVPTVKQTKVRLFSVTGGPFFGGSGGVQQAIRNLGERADIGKARQNPPERRPPDNRSTRGVTLENPGTLHETYWIP